MEAVQIKRALANAKFNLRIMWRGFCRVIYGTVITVMIAMAIYGFASVTAKTGWAAVWRFIVACVFLTEGLVNMYFIGHKKTGVGNRERRK